MPYSQNKPGGSMLVTAGGKTTVAEVTFTRPSDTNAYTAGDVVSNSTSAATILEFTAASFEGGGGVIQAATLIDSVAAGTKPEFDLYLFDTTVVMENDNAAWDPSDTEVKTFIGKIDFLAADFETMGANGVTQVRNINLPFKCVANSTILYGILVARNAYTPTSAEQFTVRLHILQD